MKKLLNGEEVEMTSEEVAAFEAARTPTLAQAKKAARKAISSRREKAETSGFLHLGVRYDSSSADLARMAVLGERARTAKATSESFSVRVAASDDSESNMNANEYIALEKSAGDHFVACSANARTLRQAVGNAADLAAVLAVDIESGWPS